MTITTNPPRTDTPQSHPAPSWWRRPWIGPLFLMATVFLVLSVPRYLTLDPSLSRLEPPEGDPIYYPLLVAHVVFGSVAMITCCFQIWPWFRRRYRRVHRITGRVYVIGGAVPAGICALYVGWNTPFGPSVQVGNLVGAALWLIVTIVGWRMARQRRYGEHRKWMIRSFALTMMIVLSRVLTVPAVIGLSAQVDTTFGGSEELMLHSATSISIWLSLITSLLLAEWWLERKVSRARPARAGTLRRAQASRGEQAMSSGDTRV
jgi:uncharacterized membrane protein YozB (DUF420 family)